MNLGEIRQVGGIALPVRTPDLIVLLKAYQSVFDDVFVDAHFTGLRIFGSPRYTEQPPRSDRPAALHPPAGLSREAT